MIASLSIAALLAALVGTAPVEPTAVAAPAVTAEAVAPAAGEATADPHAAAPVAHPAEGEHAAAGHEGPSIQDSLLKPDVAVLIATWITFGLVAWILAKYGWGPITKSLDDREAKIAEDARRAEAARADAEKLLKDYDAKLAGARGEADKVLAEARQRAEAAGQRLQTEAREQAQALTAKAMEQIEGERQKAVAELRSIVTDAAVTLAGRILKEELNPARHTRLIDDVVGQIAKK